MQRGGDDGDADDAPPGGEGGRLALVGLGPRRTRGVTPSLGAAVRWLDEHAFDWGRVGVDGLRGFTSRVLIATIDAPAVRQGQLLRRRARVFRG